jgi:hypothetical protein
MGVKLGSLTLSEGHRLRSCENIELRKTLGTRKQEETAEQIKRNEELQNLYYSPDTIRFIKSRKMKQAIQIIFVEEMRNAYKVSAGKPDWKRPLGGRCHTWEDNIKMATKETGYEDVQRILLEQERVIDKTSKWIISGSLHTLWSLGLYHGKPWA